MTIQILLAIRSNALRKACIQSCYAVWNSPEIVQASSLEQLKRHIKTGSWRLVVVSDDLASKAKLLPLLGQMRESSAIGRLICGVSNPVSWVTFAAAGGDHVCLRRSLTRRIRSVA